MELGDLETKMEQLVSTLQAFCGHRSIWIAQDGELWHAEPEDDLQELGCRYVATLMQPTREELTAAVLPLIPIEGVARMRVGRWSNPDLDAAGLAAAHAG
jgi:hypothetical protein